MSGIKFEIERLLRNSKLEFFFESSIFQNIILRNEIEASNSLLDIYSDAKIDEEIKYRVIDMMEYLGALSFSNIISRISNFPTYEKMELLSVAWSNLTNISEYEYDDLYVKVRDGIIDLLSEEETLIPVNTNYKVEIEFEPYRIKDKAYLLLMFLKGDLNEDIFQNLSYSERDILISNFQSLSS